MEKILRNIENGKGKKSDIDLLWDIQRKIEGNTICPLGDAAAWPVAAASDVLDEFSGMWIIRRNVDSGYSVWQIMRTRWRWRRHDLGSGAITKRNYYA